MNIWELDKLMLFFLFFIPGFISLKVYDSIMPSPRRDFAKAIVEAVAYSCLNYGFFSWVIYFALKNLLTDSPLSFYMLVVLILFIAPVLWPILFSRMYSWKVISNFIIHPIQKPWDYVFMRRVPYWVIVHLKDGRMVGGRYDEDSFTSSYPEKEQIYLEEVWELDPRGSFIRKTDRSKGIIIIGDEIEAIEFFE